MTVSSFAERWRAERTRLGPDLPRLVLQAVHGRRTDSRIRDWIEPYSRSELSSLLESVLDSHGGRRRHGIYATGADIARHMAQRTIVPYLFPDLAERIGDDLDRVAVERIVAANTPERVALRKRLDSLTVLDPTCGTGPFLLAALDLLDRLHRAARPAGKPFRRWIVDRSLFGIDLLPESVEICRLRLALEVDGEEPVANNIHVGDALSDEAFLLLEDRRFSVILGNPPYQELRETDLPPRNFALQSTGAVHALCLERSLDLLRPDGRLGMLVPMSLVCTQRMQCVQELLEKGRDVRYANFSWRPARLFPDVHRAVTMVLASASPRPRTWTTGYIKWRSRERPRLMERLRYIEAPRDRPSFWVPKLSDERERPLLDKLLAVPTTLADFLSDDDAEDRRIYYRTDGGLYWKVFTDFAPSFSLDGRPGRSSRETWLTVRSRAQVAPLIAVLSSDLYWWWYTLTSDCRHLNPIDLHRFPIPESVPADEKLARLGRDYLADIVRRSSSKVRRQRQTGRTETQTFRILESRPLLEAVGTALARHYRLTDDEARYIADFDLSFRLGRRSKPGG